MRFDFYSVYSMLLTCSFEPFLSHSDCIYSDQIYKLNTSDLCSMLSDLTKDALYDPLNLREFLNSNINVTILCLCLTFKVVRDYQCYFFRSNVTIFLNNLLYIKRGLDCITFSPSEISSILHELLRWIITKVTDPVASNTWPVNNYRISTSLNYHIQCSELVAIAKFIKYN